MYGHKKLAIATAVVGALLGASNANAAIETKIGDWNIQFSGNVNAFYTNASCDDTDEVVAAGLACVGDDDDVNVRTGLLPSWFGFSATTTANNFDVGVTLSFQPGVDSGQFVNGLDQALGLNTSNFRQVFLTIGNEAWGTIKFGRDLGIFASDAILSDMTLLGVGSGAGGGGGNTTLGRIGTGYIYADWKGQISYTTPNFGGLSITAGIIDPFGLSTLGAGAVSGTADVLNQSNDSPGFEAKAVYEWQGAWPGKVWVSGLVQEIDTAAGDYTANGFDIGAKVGFAGFEAVAYWYVGEGIGTTAYLFDAVSLTGEERDSDGGYVQLTYTVPGPNTKIGVSYGISNLDRASGEPVSNLVEENRSWIVGVYHPLNDFVHLVLEYTHTESEAHNGNEVEDDIISIGSILQF
ncbi:MAG: porin [Gammaproteobacteria bacterium]